MKFFFSLIFSLFFISNGYAQNNHAFYFRYYPVDSVRLSCGCRYKTQIIDSVKEDSFLRIKLLTHQAEPDIIYTGKFKFENDTLFVTIQPLLIF